MKLFIYLLTSVTITSCAHQSQSVDDKFVALLKHNKCEEASTIIPLTESEQGLFPSVKRVGGYFGSYTITLTAFTAGLVVGTMGNRHDISWKAGEIGYDKTHSMRCPDIDNVSQKLRAISTCYLDRKNKENSDRALSILLAMKDKNEFYTCLGDNEKDSLDKQVIQIRGPEVKPLPVTFSFEEERTLLYKPNCIFLEQVSGASYKTGLLNVNMAKDDVLKYFEKRAHEIKADFINIVFYARYNFTGTFMVGNVYQCKSL